MRLVLLGAPGSGKGTQSQSMVSRYGIPQVSTGDLLREAVAAKSELGLAAKAIMDAGKLVADEVMLGIIRERLARADAVNGFILDGFPRTLAQAEGLKDVLTELGTRLDAVVLMQIDPAVLLQRLSGRRTCRACDRVFNIATNPPAADDLCEGGKPHDLFQRPDDDEAIISKRLSVYREQTAPLVEHYRKLGMLRTVDADGALDVVLGRLETALADVLPKR